MFLVNVKMLIASCGIDLYLIYLSELPVNDKCLLFSQ